MDLDGYQESVGKELFFLKEINKITKKDSDSNNKWRWLIRQYEIFEKRKEPIIKAVITVMNSILYQEKEFFFMTRENIKDLIKKDTNWKKKVGFSEKNYPSIIKFMTHNKIIALEPYEEQNSRKPSLYKVIDQELRSLLSSCDGSQRPRAVSFINGESRSGLPNNLNSLEVFNDEKWENLSFLVVKNTYIKNPKEYKEIQKMELRVEFLSNSMDRLDESDEQYKELEEELSIIQKNTEAKKDRLWASEYYLNFQFYNSLKSRKKVSGNELK